MTDPKTYCVDTRTFGDVDCDNAPSIAIFKIDEDSAKEIVRLSHLIKANGLHKIEKFDYRVAYFQFNPETEPEDANEAGDQNKVRVDCPTLVVMQDEFLFGAYIKHTEVKTAIERQSIAELAAHFGIPVEPAQQKFVGHFEMDGLEVDVEFQAPALATTPEMDAAFMAALAQKATINYEVEPEQPEKDDADPADEPGHPYDPADFARNPGKYALFRTAKIACSIESSPHFKVGQTVKIRHYANQVNHFAKGELMPIYHVWVNNSDDIEESSMLYALALKDFCL